MQNFITSLAFNSASCENNYLNFLRLKTVFENSHASIQICNVQGRTTFINEAWKNLWRAPDDFISEFMSSKFNILESTLIKRKGLLPYIHRAYSGEVVDTPVIRFSSKDLGITGKDLLIQASLYPIRDYSGNVDEIILFLKDVTAHELASEKYNFIANVASILLETLDYNKTLERVALATIPFLADGCVVDMLENGEIKRLVSKHHDPEIEKELVELQNNFPPKMTSAEPTVNVIKSGLPEIRSDLCYEELATKIQDPDHLKKVEQTLLKSHMAVPIKLRGTTIGAINFGITSDRRHFSDNDLKIAIEVARHAALAIDNARLYRDAQKAIQQREDFISMASHELKTPITNLTLKLDVLLTSAKTESRKDFLERLGVVTNSTRQQLNRLSHLVDNMLDVARINKVKLSRDMTRVDLSSLVTEVIGRLSEQFISQSVPLTIDIDNSYYIDADPFRIEQVITNLIVNALRYGQDKHITIKVCQSNDKVLFKITDEGIGIARENHERIFERYERVLGATEGQGLGLGLYISRQIINEHSGKIYLESELGKGSTFTFELNKSEQ